MAGTGSSAMELGTGSSVTEPGGQDLVPVDGSSRSATHLANLTRGTGHEETVPRPQLPLGTWVNAKQVQESAIVIAVRKQLEALEDKLTRQFAKDLSRISLHSDRLRDAAIARVDAKVGTLEALHQKLDRRVAELGGSCKGLSEEMQSQIRRVDQMDSQLYAWRQQVDEEIHLKITQIEQSYTQVCSNIRVSRAGSDDQLKRLAARLVRVEEQMEERCAHAVDISHSVMNLHDRLLQVEDPTSERWAALQQRDLSIAGHSMEIGEHAFTAILEKQRADILHQVELLQQDCAELRARFESQEEIYRHLRTLWETKDEQFRALRQRVEHENVESRLKELHRRVQGIEQGGIGHSERLEILHKKIEDQQGQHLSSHFSSFYRELHVEEGMKAKEAAEVVLHELSVTRVRAADARAKVAEARNVMGLLTLNVEQERELKTVTDRGIVQLVLHDVQDEPGEAEPASGSRFIVTEEPALMGRLGTLVEQAGDDEWTVLLDNGSRTVLRTSDFHVAPRPVASLNLNVPLDFKGVQHFGPTTAIYEDEFRAMQVLADAAQVLNLYSTCIVSIEGHTATLDSKMDTWAHELAHNRAEKVKEGFMALGIDERRIKTVGLPGRLGSSKQDTVIKIVAF